MRITITGTPGTGKTSVARILQEKLKIPLYHLSEAVKEYKLFSSYDKEREAFVADVEKLVEFFSKKKSFLAEGLIAHYIPADICIILRASPKEIERRLSTRNYSIDKIKENAESEKLDVIATEVFQNPNAPLICQIDTTNKKVEEVAKLIEKCIKGERIFENVDWLEEQENSYRNSGSL